MFGKRWRTALAAVGVLAGLAAAVTPAVAAPPPPSPPTHAIAWGKGGFGQLGDGGNGNEQIPVQVRRPELGFTEVAGSLSHSLAIAADGTVWAWGQNNNGQLGDGTATDTNEPVKVKDLTDIVEVSAGWGFSLARSRTGRVWAWGANWTGQLGIGSFGGAYNTPQLLQELSDVTHIEAGWFHSMALKDYWTVMAWGANSRGQLGDGTGIEKASPIEVQGLTGGDSGPVVDVAAGFHHTLVERADGTLLSFGANNSGQLGNGTTSVPGAFSPVHVIGRFGHVRAMAAGCAQSYLVDGSGQVWGWGDNTEAQVAISGNVVTQPKVIPGLSGVAEVAAGCAFGLALTFGGQAYGWGQYNSGQTGTGNPTPMPPFPVVGGNDLTFIAAGGDHGLAARLKN